MAIPIERLPPLSSMLHFDAPEPESSSGLQGTPRASVERSVDRFESFPATVEEFRPILQAGFWLANIKTVPINPVLQSPCRRTMRSMMAISATVLDQLIIKILTITNIKFGTIKGKMPFLEVRRFHDQLQGVLEGGKCDDVIYTTAKICAAIDPSRTVEKIKRFCLKDQNALFNVAMVCAREDGLATARNIQRFGIRDETLLFEVFKRCGGVAVLEELPLFDIWNTDVVALVFNHCRQQDEEKTVSFFSRHPERDPRRGFVQPDMGDGWEGNVYQNPEAVIRLQIATDTPFLATVQLGASQPPPLTRQQR